MKAEKQEMRAVAVHNNRMPRTDRMDMTERTDLILGILKIYWRIGK